MVVVEFPVTFATEKQSYRKDVEQNTNKASSMKWTDNELHSSDLKNIYRSFKPQKFPSVELNVVPNSTPLFDLATAPMMESNTNQSVDPRVDQGINLTMDLLFEILELGSGRKQIIMI